MGKDLRGKELGRGLYRRKDRKYIARILCGNKRLEKSFDKLPDAKIWLNRQRYLKDNGKITTDKPITVNAWFEYWISEIKGFTLRDTTIHNYQTKYKPIGDIIGEMKVSDIKPLHCQMVLNELNCAQKTSEQIRIIMGQLFSSAVENGLISTSPVTRQVKFKKMPQEERRVFTVSEQQMFVDYIKSHNHRYKDQYLLCLETGMRVGEINGLFWQDIKDNKISVGRTVTYIGSILYMNEPKTAAGWRHIPLTTSAQEILSKRRQGKIVGMNYVFSKNGNAIRAENYNNCLKTICKHLGIEPITMHGLRHSFATRCIEAGMTPKTLQYILGHTRIELTMNLYVHVTQETVVEEMTKLDEKIGGRLVVEDLEYPLEPALLKDS